MTIHDYGLIAQLTLFVVLASYAVYMNYKSKIKDQ